jgi:hypothetical protein
MNVKGDFFTRGPFAIGNGMMNTRFWEDAWLGNKLLTEQCPSLYQIIGHIDVTVDVFAMVPLNTGFRRALMGNK